MTSKPYTSYSSSFCVISCRAWNAGLKKELIVLLIAVGQQEILIITVTLSVKVITWDFALYNLYWRTVECIEKEPLVPAKIQM